MFDGLSKREIIGWVVCLVLAVGLTLFGGAYLVASSFMSADVSDVLKPDSPKRSQQQTP
jgi:cell division protein FtsX